MSGVGFFTEFEVPRRVAPATGLANPIGHVRSGVGPDRYPLEFMLWVTDGYAHTIEASLFAPGTTISATIANEFTEATTKLYSSSLILLGLILFFITVVVLMAAKWLTARGTRKAGI